MLKEDLDETILASIAEKADISVVELINTRSQVFRKLAVDINNISEKEATKLMLAHPRIIIRPIFVWEGQVLFRFVEEDYKLMLS